MYACILVFRILTLKVLVRTEDVTCVRQANDWKQLFLYHTVPQHSVEGIIHRDTLPLLCGGGFSASGEDER